MANFINFERKLDDQQALDLIQEVTPEEVRQAMFSLKDNKAPGLDGYTAHFYKQAWSVVGDDVTKAIQHFFRSGKLLSEVNSTTISLVPKVPNPTSLNDFRPISCCNTNYKCISKIISNRLKFVVDFLVGPNQSAFISGRNIFYNIFLSHELLRNYHRDTGPSRCAK